MVTPLTDEALAETIRADGIDILVDLNGPRGRHRLLAFACGPRPADHALRYPGRPLRAMDYRVTDAVADPPARRRGACTSRSLLRLPTSGAVRAAGRRRRRRPTPRGERAGVHLRLSESPRKLSEPCADAWAAILSGAEVAAGAARRAGGRVGGGAGRAVLAARRRARPASNWCYRWPAGDYMEAYQRSTGAGPVPLRGA